MSTCINNTYPNTRIMVKKRSVKDKRTMVPFPHDLVPHVTAYVEATGMTLDDAVSRLALIGDFTLKEFEAMVAESKTGECLYPKEHGDKENHSVVFDELKSFYDTIRVDSEFWKERINVRFFMNSNEHSRYKERASTTFETMGHTIALRVYIGLRLIRRIAIMEKEHKSIVNKGDMTDDEYAEAARISKFLYFCWFNIIDMAGEREIQYWVQVERKHLDEVRKKEIEFVLNNKKF